MTCFQLCGTDLTKSYYILIWAKCVWSVRPRFLTKCQELYTYFTTTAWYQVTRTPSSNGGNTNKFISSRYHLHFQNIQCFNVTQKILIVYESICIFSCLYVNKISNNQSSYLFLITMRQHCHTSVYITNEKTGHVVSSYAFIFIIIMKCTIPTNECA